MNSTWRNSVPTDGIVVEEVDELPPEKAVMTEKDIIELAGKINELILDGLFDRLNNPKHVAEAKLQAVNMLLKQAMVELEVITRAPNWEGKRRYD